MLNNSADVFDWGDTIPPALIQQVQQADRPVQGGPDQQDVLLVPERHREAVQQAARPCRPWIDGGRPTGAGAARQRHARPRLLPAPAGDGRAPDAPCPYGDPELVAGHRRRPRSSSSSRGWPAAGHRLGARTASRGSSGRRTTPPTLNAIGFKATLKTIADAEYFSTIETLKNHPQTGFADWQQDFPNPTDFYQNLVDANAIAAGGQLQLRGGQRPAHPVEAEGALPGAGGPAGERGVEVGRRSTTTSTKKAYLAVVRLPVVASVLSRTGSTSASSCSARCTAPTSARCS